MFILRSRSVLSLLFAAFLGFGCATRTSTPIASSAEGAPGSPPPAAGGFGVAKADGWPAAESGNSPREQASATNPSDYEVMPTAPSVRGEQDDYRAKAGRPERRPGLATRWGERRDSSVQEVEFRRDDPSHPFAVLAFHYDDEDGVAWKTGRDPEDALPSVFSVRGGAIEVSIVSASENPLRQLQAEGRTYVLGETDDRYAIRLTNHTRDRYEVVASVDGLDVLSGSDAHYASRGYVLAPWATLLIEGFRDSAESVRAFRFGDIDESYAVSRGRGRDVGVIGVALFDEDLGGRRAYTDAPQAFPGQFAPPPGR